jgi:hypothetical protein
MNERIYAKVMETHQLLDEYIIIHNELIAPPKGVFAILKKLFKPINFDSYVSRLSAMAKGLNDSYLELEGIDDDNLRDKELELKKMLSQFVTDLKQTVEKLNEINRRLAKKATGETYSMSEYNMDLREYQILVDSYTATGSQLNLIFKEQD